VPSGCVGGGGATPWRVGRSSRAQEMFTFFRGGVGAEELREWGQSGQRSECRADVWGVAARHLGARLLSSRAEEIPTGFGEAPEQRSCESLGLEGMKLRVPSGFVGRWWHDADRAARTGKFQVFEEVSRRRSCESWGTRR
jgi:hypothetical protein